MGRQLLVESLLFQDCPPIQEAVHRQRRHQEISFSKDLLEEQRDVEASRDGENNSHKNPKTTVKK